MLRKFVLGALVSAALSSQAPASCLLEQALHNIEIGAIKLTGEYGREMMPILNELKKLTPKNSNSDLPIGLQMSPQASQRFERLSFDILKLRSQRMILSAYVRDARVIAKAAQVAENVRKGKEYGDKDPDFFYYGILLLTSVAHENPDGLDQKPSTDECSLDGGLWVSEKSILDQLDDGAKLKLLGTGCKLPPGNTTSICDSKVGSANWTGYRHSPPENKRKLTFRLSKTAPRILSSSRASKLCAPSIGYH
jgi:hypothetical protein